MTFQKYHINRTESFRNSRKNSTKNFICALSRFTEFCNFFTIEDVVHITTCAFQYCSRNRFEKTWNGKITFAKILFMYAIFLRTCFRRRLVHERKVKSFTLLNRICNVMLFRLIQIKVMIGNVKID